MKVIIAGGRDYHLTDSDYERLQTLKPVITELISGACPSGVDLESMQWAQKEGIPVRKFPADWKTHGRAAGPIRNAQMAEAADALIVFPGGRGTANMVEQARKRHLPVWDWRQGA